MPRLPVATKQLVGDAPSTSLTALLILPWLWVSSVTVRREIPLLVAALVAGLASSGCSRSEAQEAPSPTRKPTVESEEVERLRSLPYLSGVLASRNDTTGVVRRDPTRSCPGYNLYETQPLSRADLIDERGTVLKSWSHAPSDRWERADLLPDGDLIVIGVDPYVWTDGGPPHRIADSARYVMRLTWQGQVRWKKSLCAHHDIEQTPDGRLLLLTFEKRIVPEIHVSIPTRDDHLTLLDTDGNVVESHSMLEAIRRASALFSLHDMQPFTIGGKPFIDLLHSNSVEWMRRKELVGRNPIYDLGNILVCFRHQNRIAVFNWKRNKVIWSWGDGELSGPHDAQVLEDGHILLFDNGLGRNASRVLEIDPPSGRIVWQYSASPPRAFFSESKGSAQRLPNGNTLIAESDKGRAFEVTPDGKVVWEYVSPHRFGTGMRAALVRMRRIPSALIDPLLREGR